MARVFSGADKIDLRDPFSSRLLISSILCNDSTNADGVEIGDPTETALINLGSSLGLDPEEVRIKYPRESENPFDSDRKDDGNQAFIERNANDDLSKELLMCFWTGQTGLGDERETHEITEETRRVIEAAESEILKRDYEFLHLLIKMYQMRWNLRWRMKIILIFLGLIAMMDPPREESKAAVEECKCAGIRPIMITGDHKVTAAAIAKELEFLKMNPKPVRVQRLTKCPMKN